MHGRWRNCATGLWKHGRELFDGEPIDAAAAIAGRRASPCSRDAAVPGLRNPECAALAFHRISGCAAGVGSIRAVSVPGMSASLLQADAETTPRGDRNSRIEPLPWASIFGSTAMWHGLRERMNTGPWALRTFRLPTSFDAAISAAGCGRQEARNTWDSSRRSDRSTRN